MLIVVSVRGEYAAAAPAAPSRADIVDRNGAPLATNDMAPSLYANPREITDARETAARIVPLGC
jgi:cell division protein FtsI/penicillin-binding protein 2